MFGRKKPAQGAARIKANTIGTSNEISLNVLENARDDLGDSKKPNVVKVSRVGRSVGVVSLLFSKIRFPSKGSSQSFSADEGKAAGSSNVKRAERRTSSSRAARKAERVQAHAQAKEARQRRHAAKHSLSRENVQDEPYSRETAQAEIERRKRIRRRRRIRLRVVATACVAAVAFACYYGYHQYQLHAGQSSLLAEAMHEISSADDGLVQLDELLADPIDEVGGDDWSQLHAGYRSMKGHLSSAESIANELIPLLSDGDMKTAAGQVVDACSARTAMLDSGESIFAAAEDAKKTADTANDTWNDVLSADGKAREGISLLSSGSIDDSMSAAKSKIEEASADFSNLMNALAQIESQYKGLDLSAQREYLEKRIEALGYAASTAQALINRDKASASAYAERYNAADAEATKLAAALSDAPAKDVETAFDENVKDERQRYSNARYAATQADGIIRNYLGV